MHIVIIGNGISGITTARYLRKLSDHKITVISSESAHFYSRTALMYIYMGHMKMEDTKPYEDWFWQKNRIDLVNDHVMNIDFDGQKLQMQKGTEIAYDKLVLALGSKSNKFGWPGQDLKGVGGLYHLQDLENMEAYSDGLKRAVIVGGGLIGIEMAEMFHSRGIDVTMLVRESSYWDNILPPEESRMVSDHILDNHIDLRLGSNLGEIKDNGSGQCKSVVIKETSEEIPCGYVGLTAGVSPNIGWLKETQLETGRGIQVNEYLETNIANVYAVGDCAEQVNPMPGRRGVEAIWYTGRMMGETAAYNIVGQPVKYDPGIWFNFWKHADNQKSIRINYDTATKALLGINLMGVRYRHEVCEKWLGDGTHVEEVLQNLGLANFDPEFYATYEEALIDRYNQQNGTNLSLKTKRGLSKVLSFLSSKA